MASKEEKRLKSAVKGRVKAQDKATDAFIGSLERFLKENIQRIVERIASGDVDIVEAAATLGQLENSLEELGLSKQYRPVRQMYADELEFVRDEFDLLTGRNVFTRLDAETANVLINFETNKIDQEVRTYLGDLKSQMMRSIIAGERFDVDRNLNQFGERAARNIRTEVNTGLQAYNRSITAKKAKETFGDNPKFIYIGPDDKVTRPFCDELLGKDPAIYTLKEIEGLDNGQGLDVMTFGGGYNCRHHWRPVSDDLAEELGA